MQIMSTIEATHNLQRLDALAVAVRIVHEIQKVSMRSDIIYKDYAFTVAVRIVHEMQKVSKRYDTIYKDYVLICCIYTS